MPSALSQTEHIAATSDRDETRRELYGRLTCALLDSARRLPGVPLVMNLMNAKLMVVGTYLLAVAAATVASGVRSGAGLIVLAAVAVLPAGALLTLWKHPSQTLSQTIQAARR